MKIDYEVFSLENGLKVLLIPSNTTYSANITAIIKSGQALEDKKTHGLTHFVEHVALAATEKWPSKQHLNETTEFNGANIDGGTSKESLYYYINIPYNKVPFGIEFIYQVLYKSTFANEYIEQERTIILDEIAKREDNPWSQQVRATRNLLFKNKTAYGNEIGGTKERVQGFTRKDLVNHYKLVHDPSKVLLSVVGNFKKEEAKKLVNKYFKDLESYHKPLELPQEEINEAKVVVRKNKKTDLVLNSINFKGLSYKKVDQKTIVTLGLVNTLASGPMSSRLKNRLREKEGLLYGIWDNEITFEKHGLLGFEYSISKENCVKALNILLEELQKLYDKGVTEKELKHYKEYLYNRNLIHYDNIYSYSTLISKPVIKNKEVLKLEEINKLMKSITKAEIDQFIKKYFQISKASLTITGNVDKELENDIKKVMESIR